MSEDSDGIMPLPNGKILQKGMAGLKQVVISMVIILIAALILAAMVLYTVAVLRTAQSRMLTGEAICKMSQRGYEDRQPGEYPEMQWRLCRVIVGKYPEIMPIPAN